MTGVTYYSSSSSDPRTHNPLIEPPVTASEGLITTAEAVQTSAKNVIPKLDNGTLKVLPFELRARISSFLDNSQQRELVDQGIFATAITDMQREKTIAFIDEYERAVTDIKEGRSPKENVAKAGSVHDSLVNHLQIAAENGHVASIHQFLKNKDLAEYLVADVFRRAAEYGQTAIIDLICKDEHSRNNLDSSTFFHACEIAEENNHIVATDRLLEFVKNRVNETECLFAVFRGAAGRNHAEIVKLVLDRYGDKLNDAVLQDALERAALGGANIAADLILDRYKDRLDDHTLRHLLAMAITPKGHFLFVEMLLKHAVDRLGDNVLLAAIMDATRVGHTDIIGRLLDEFQHKRADKRVRQAIRHAFGIAVANQRMSVVRPFLDRNFLNVVGYDDIQKSFAYAAMQGETDVVRLMLEQVSLRLEEKTLAFALSVTPANNLEIENLILAHMTSNTEHKTQ